jgi:pimeloyl-ACP methyl ester carboxylesterase
MNFREDDGSVDVLGAMNDLDKNPKALIPLERATADLLLLAGMDDHNFDSALYARAAAERLAKSSKRNYEVALFEGMGHLAHLPYSPGMKIGLDCQMSK